MSDPASTSTGLFASLRRILGTALEAAITRVELLAIELQTEKCRLIELILLAAIAAFLGMLAVVLLAITLVLLVPEDYRLSVLGGGGIVCLLAAVIMGVRLRSRLKSPPPFSETLAQLKKDREWLASRK